MADLGTAYVQILPEANGIKGKISSALAPEATTAGTMAGKTVARNLGNSLSSLGGSMIKAGAIATAVSVPIIKGIKAAMSAYKDQNAAETKLTEIYKTRMGATQKAAKATIEYAGALQKQGVVGDEVTLAGAQQLATFAKMPSTVNSLLPAMQNLLVQQKGLNGTQQDATQIANLMGKVMMGQTGALKRVGVSFTEAEEKVLKYGTEEEKAAMLAQVITNNVGNMNQAMLETPEGKIQQMKNSFGDLAEKLGATLAPALADIANWLSNNLIPKIDELLSKIQSNPIFGKIAVGIAGVLAAGGPLMIILGTIVKSVGTLVSAASGAGGAFGMLGKAAKLLTGPFGIIAGIFGILFTKSEAFRNAIISLGQSIMSAILPVIKQIMPIVQQIMAAINQIVVQVGSALAPVIQQLIPIIQMVITTVGQLITNVMSAIMPVIRQLVPIITSIATTVVNVMSKILGVVMPVVQKIIAFVMPAVQRILTIVAPVLQRILSVVTTVLNAVRAVFSRIWGAIGPIVTKAVNGIKTVIGGISSVVGKVTSTFTNVKNAILKPVQAVRDKVRGIIDKIKGFFNFKVKTPHIPKPHFGITPKGWKVGDLLKGKIPHLSIDWKAKGGIVNDATLIGAGEAGPEAILPLNPFWDKLNAWGASIVDQAGSYEPNDNNPVVVSLQLDGKEFARAVAQPMQNELNKMDTRNNRKLGYL